MHICFEVLTAVVMETSVSFAACFMLISLLGFLFDPEVKTDIFLGHVC
jgi:hypothetical protein